MDVGAGGMGMLELYIYKVFPLKVREVINSYEWYGTFDRLLGGRSEVGVLI